MIRRFVVAIGAGLALAGCAAIGPRQVGPDRYDYMQRLRESEKSQLLANIVALRYGDAPLFLSVASVISQYTFESSAHAHAGISPPPDAEAGNADLNVLLRETPTITYTPMTGERFARSLLTPIPPASLLGMMEAGWASDQLFALSVRSFNGVRNASHAPLFEQEANASFHEISAAMRRLQRTGGMSIRIHERDKALVATVTLSPDLTPEQAADVALLRRALNAPLAGAGGVIAFGSQPRGPDELAITTRSIFEILQEASEGVDLTGADTIPALPLLRVHSGSRAPGDAHASVRYRDRWFWIDGSDATSKRAFLLIQVLVSLADDQSGARAPLVTIPAG